MYRLLINIEGLPSSRVFVRDLNEADLIVFAFLHLARMDTGIRLINENDSSLVDYVLLIPDKSDYIFSYPPVPGKLLRMDVRIRRWNRPNGE